MTSFDVPEGMIRAPIARGRVAEMLRRGWTVVGEVGEGRVIMAGPDPDGDWMPVGFALESMSARAVSRASRSAA